jgi:hypothetical protein
MSCSLRFSPLPPQRDRARLDGAEDHRLADEDHREQTLARRSGVGSRYVPRIIFGAGEGDNRAMPRDGAIIFGDLIGKLDVLRIEYDKCGLRSSCRVPRSTSLRI